MIKNSGLTFIAILSSLIAIGQVQLYKPLDVIYNDSQELYYVSNWADSNGYVVTMNKFGIVTANFFDDLHFAGGMILIDDILYIADNMDRYVSGVYPSYLVMVDINTGEQIDKVMVSPELVYLDFLETDNQGNIYITDSHSYRIYKYEIATQQIDTILNVRSKPLGICYDYIEDRFLYTESGPYGSLIMSMDMQSGDTTALFWWPEYIEDLIMNENGEYFFDTWGNGQFPFGDERVYKLNHIMDWTFELSNSEYRPFGMCFGHDNVLAVSNHGDVGVGNVVHFLDLTPYGTEDLSFEEQHMGIYPNPCDGKIRLKLPCSSGISNFLQVKDLSGRVVFNDFFGEVNCDLALDLSHLPSGMYMVVVEQGTVLYREKLVIQ